MSPLRLRDTQVSCWHQISNTDREDGGDDGVGKLRAVKLGMTDRRHLEPISVPPSEGMNSKAQMQRGRLSLWLTHHCRRISVFEEELG